VQDRVPGAIPRETASYLYGVGVLKGHFRTPQSRAPLHKVDRGQYTGYFAESPQRTNSRDA